MRRKRRKPKPRKMTNKIRWRNFEECVDELLIELLELIDLTPIGFEAPGVRSILETNSLCERRTGNCAVCFSLVSDAS